MNNKPWLIIDEHHYDVIVGNREGLTLLKEQIEEAIVSSEKELKIEVDGIGLEKIILTENDIYETFSKEEKWWEKIVICFFGTWFLILPFVAIAFIVKVFIK